VLQSFGISRHVGWQTEILKVDEEGSSQSWYVSAREHGITSQQTVTFITAAVRTSNQTSAFTTWDSVLLTWKVGNKCEAESQKSVPVTTFLGFGNINWNCYSTFNNELQWTIMDSHRNIYVVTSLDLQLEEECCSGVYSLSIPELNCFCLLNGGGGEEFFRVSFPHDNTANCRYSAA
jgi:hypothetical protein